MTEQPAIREGQIWRENDKRFERFVRVMAGTGRNYVLVRTSDLDGNVKKGARTSYVHAPRFVVAFTLIKDKATTLQET